MAFSFLGFVLATLPLAWQLEGTVFVNFSCFGTFNTHLTNICNPAWNVGCSLYGFWSGLACLIQFINHYAWRHTARNIAPVWCEIGDY